MSTRGDLPEGLVRPALAGLVPYQGGKPVEEVQREFGLERVAKLASNEGEFGPFPAALAAIEAAAGELNRYPDGAAFELTAALAEKHGVEPASIVHGAGADAVIGYIAQSLLDPGDEVVYGWPSFASYPLHALKMGAELRPVGLRDHRYDLDALLAETTPRTKIVFVCNPNNPTGTMVGRDELEAYFERVPGHVLTVLDEAYFEYVDDSDYPDGVEEYFKAGKQVAVLRTFSKLYGLAGLRCGYAVTSPALAGELGKVRPAFDLNSLGQLAALASLGDEGEIARRRARSHEALAALAEILEQHDLAPAAPSVANFHYCELAQDSRGLYDELLRRGVIVRPLHGFGAPNALRITAGSDEEHSLLAKALESLGLSAV